MHLLCRKSHCRDALRLQLYPSSDVVGGLLARRRRAVQRHASPRTRQVRPHYRPELGQRHSSVQRRLDERSSDYEVDSEWLGQGLGDEEFIGVGGDGACHGSNPLGRGLGGSGKQA